MADIWFSDKVVIYQANLIGGDGGLNFSTTLRLFKNNVTPNPLTLLSAFTEADFSGYAGVDLGWNGASYSEGSSAAINDLIDPAVFTHSGDTVHNNIFGWYLTRYDVAEDTTMLVASMRYDNAPIGMNTPGQSITENLHLYVGAVFLQA